MLGFTAPAVAQDNKATIESVAKIIKSKPADLAKQAKDFKKEYKKNPEVLVGIGRAFYDEKDTATARSFANAAVERDKKYAPAFVLIGDIEALSNDGGNAAAYYDQAIYADPKNPEPYYKYASVYSKISPSTAVQKLEDLRIQRPDIAVDALAGQIYYRANQFEKAVKAYEKAGLDKLDERNITELAMSYYFLGKNPGSLATAKYGLTKSPRDAAFNRLAFFNCTDLKDYENALIYADALFNKSDSAKFSYLDYAYYGNAYSGLKQYDKAIEQYEKALQQEFDSKAKRAGVCKSLSDAYSGKGEYDKAIASYNEYLGAIETKTAFDYVGLAKLYTLKADTQTGDARNATFQEAAKVYDEIEQKYPQASEYALFMKARVNSYMDPDNSKKLAKPYYEKLVSIIEPKATKDEADKARLIEGCRYLGYIYLMEENTTQADKYWNLLLTVDPTNETAKEALNHK